MLLPSFFPETQGGGTGPQSLLVCAGVDAAGSRDGLRRLHVCLPLPPPCIHHGRRLHWHRARPLAGVSLASLHDSSLVSTDPLSRHLWMTTSVHHSVNLPFDFFSLSPSHPFFSFSNPLLILYLFFHFLSLFLLTYIYPFFSFSCSALVSLSLLYLCLFICSSLNFRVLM